MKAKQRKERIEVEAVFFYLYDAGRSIDLPKALDLLRAGKAGSVRMRRDTPESIALPRPLVLNLAEGAGEFGHYSAAARIYQDGAISLVLRRKLESSVAELCGIRKLPFGPEREDMAAYAAKAFEALFDRIRHLVDHGGYTDEIALKTYAAYCIVSDVGDPGTFIAAHSRAVGALLIDESDDPGIHDSQIANTLANPFSYRSNELAVFDFDRCLIVDPEGDYEDLLLVAEHANYQLLELRQLDLLLDRRLEVAEADMRSVFLKRRKLAGFKSFGRKLAEIQALRLDALFILENLENSSKIIGDYHLGRVYAQLCAILNTAGWKWSVERRLETLQSIYELARGDVNDRTMMVLEIIFILVCVFQVIQYFLLA